MRGDPRPWSEKRDTPHKFKAGIRGPGCRCCRGMLKRKRKPFVRAIVRARAKHELLKELQNQESA